MLYTNEFKRRYATRRRLCLLPWVENPRLNSKRRYATKKRDDMHQVLELSATVNQEAKTQACSMCGSIVGDAWETKPTRRDQLLLRPRQGDATHLWIVCDECNEGLQNTALPKPDRIHLLAQIRRATIQDQDAVLKGLLQKFNLESKKKR